MDFADRVTTLTLEGAYYMLGRAQALEATGKEIIHLEVGQPDVPTFEHISRAGIDAIEEGYVSYSPLQESRRCAKPLPKTQGTGEVSHLLRLKWWLVQGRNRLCSSPR